MNIRQLFRSSWDILRSTPMIWVFALIYFVVHLGSRVAFLIGLSETMLKYWVFIQIALNISVLLLLATGVLVTTGRVVNGQSASMRSALNAIGKHILPIILIAIITLALYMLVQTLVGNTLISLANQNIISPALTGSLIMLENFAQILVSAALEAWLFFSIAGILLEGRVLGDALRHGWHIYMQRLGSVLMVAAMFLVMQYVLRGVASGLEILLDSSLISRLAGMDLLGALQYLLLGRAGILVWFIFFPLLLDPLKYVMLARLYLPARPAKEEAERVLAL